MRYAPIRSLSVTVTAGPDRGVTSMRTRQRPLIPSTGIVASYRPPPEALSAAVYAFHMFIEGIENPTRTCAPSRGRPSRKTRNDKPIGPLARLGVSVAAIESPLLDPRAKPADVRAGVAALWSWSTNDCRP